MMNRKRLSQRLAFGLFRLLSFSVVVILFAILRVFFFKPVLAGQTDEQKSDSVGTELVERAAVE